jgi:hypothetical protein
LEKWKTEIIENFEKKMEKINLNHASMDEVGVTSPILEIWKKLKNEKISKMEKLKKMEKWKKLKKNNF